MSTQRPTTREYGSLFVELTGLTTLTEPQDAVGSTVTELDAEHVEMWNDVASTVRETGMEDALETPERDR